MNGGIPVPGPISPGKRVSRLRRPEILIFLAIAVATLAAYSPVIRAGFVYDDSQYLQENPHVRGGITGENAVWAFTSFHAANWHPLTWLSHQLDVSLFGLRPAGHHVTNLLLHTLNTGLLFFVLLKMTGAVWRSLLVAALFALHPLHVESVAWVSERKDLLSACFFLLALEAYRRYAGRPGLLRYVSVALLFTLGLLSKPMLVTFPCVLLLLDWWPLQRLGPRISGRALGRLILEKLPLLAISLAAGGVTLLAQRTGWAIVSWEALSPVARVSNAAISYVIYLEKTIWPTSLAIFYPYPRGGHPLPLVVVSLAIIAGLTFAGVRLARRRPWFLAGWLWFAGTLVPVAGFVQVGGQALADRYTYLPLIGIFMAVAWGLAELAQRGALPARSRLPLAVAVLLGLAALTWRQAGYWRDQRTVFAHAAAVTEGNHVAHFALGVAADGEGRGDDAIAHYREAIRPNPRFFDAQLKLGNALVGRGDVEAGIAAFRHALKSRPQSVEALVNLGAVESRLKHYDGALAAYRQAVALKPDLVEGSMNIGNVLSELGRDEEALGWYAQALRYGPERVEVHFNLGLTLERLGRGVEAAREYREALRIRPGHADAMSALVRLGRSGPVSESPGGTSGNRVP